jgi:hypothetical protein
MARAANSSAGGFGLLRCSFGSSYGRARRSGAGRDGVRQGPARCGKATDGGTELLSEAPCHPQGWSWRGEVGSGKFCMGVVRHGLVGQCPARAATAARRASALPAALTEGRLARARSGPVGFGKARSGQLWRGAARADDLSTEPFGALCWVLRNPVRVRSGRPGCGAIRQSVARRGGAGQGLISARRTSAFPAGFYGIQLWRGMARSGKARLHMARHGRLRRVRARLRSAGQRQGLTISARRATALPAEFTDNH